MRYNKRHMDTNDTTTETSSKSFIILLLLSIFIGSIGIDRFYLGKIGTGVLKLITFGGLGIWWLIDLIIIVSGNMRDAEGKVVRSGDSVTINVQS